ncbi:MAG: DUF3857 domain-containing protein, partial [bacterium]
MKSPALLPAVLVFAFAAPIARAAEWGEFTREELFATHLEEAPGADAAVLLDHGTLRVDDKNRLHFTHHRRVKIFTDEGTRQNVVRIPYPGAKIERFRAHTVVPPETRIKVKDEHVREEQTPEGPVRVVTFPDVRPGAILEISYELINEKLDRVEPWFFQTEHFTRESRLDLQLPKGLSFRAFPGRAAGGLPKTVTDEVNDPGKAERRLVQTTWIARNVLPERPMPMTPNAADHRPTLYVQLTSFESNFESFPIERSWAELGGAIAADYDAAWRANARAAEWVGASVDGIPGPEGKARALYLRVRDGIRNGAPPDPPVDAEPKLAEALAAGTGSPVEKNLVLVQLLRSHGIDAAPVLIVTRDRGTFFPDWRTAAQLNHAIVAVRLATGTVFADASDPSCPFGVLPLKCSVEQGLSIAREGSAVVPVTARPVESSRTVITSAELDAQGDLVVQSTWTLAGHPAFEARSEIVGHGALALAEKVIRARFPASTVDSVGVAGEKDDGAPLEITTTFRVPGWAARNGSDLSCPAPFVFAGDGNPLGAGERETPVTYGYACRSEESLSLRVPAGLSVPAPPAETLGRTPEVSFSVRYQAQGPTLEGHREFRVRETVVEKPGIGALEDLYGRLTGADSAMLTVKR